MERIDFQKVADAADALAAPVSVVKEWVTEVSLAEAVSPADFRARNAAGRADKLVFDCEFLTDAVWQNAGEDGDADAVINPVAHAAARTDELLALDYADVPAPALKALEEIRDVLGRMPVWA